MQQSKYRSIYPFQLRLEDGCKVLQIFPDKIPTIVERAPNSNVAELQKCKYLLPPELTVARLYYQIRKCLKLSMCDALYCFVNNITPGSASTIGELYEKYKNEDKFLYIAFSDDNVFGYGC